jgi:AraC family transcriptional regulator of adaptative response/methylated-DNA-[protein]-cysteine methyltransferase
VAFHRDRAQAERAGFRACKRCRPDLPPKAEREAAVVARACRMIAEAETLPSLDDLAASAGVSRFHFHRLFRRIAGVTPKAYAQAARGQRVQAGLAAAGSVTEAIYEAGFNSAGRFYAGADAMLGMAPAAYRAGGAGEVIGFAIGTCALGLVLVAQAARGICAILLGDDAEALAADLHARFPRAVIRRDAALAESVQRVVAYVARPGDGLGLPLDIRGTAFQCRVWQALQAIPAGQTRTYSELADAVGAPKAVRAVASACAANKIAVAVPCHRVIARDGGLAGYRWGIDRKRALLARERDADG